MAIMQLGIKNPGEIAKMQSPGEDGLMKFFWRGSAALPTLRAGQGRVWGGNPSKIDQGNK